MNDFYVKVKNRLKYYFYLPFSNAYTKSTLVDFDEGWFKNKRVAIIGGADSVLKEKLGAFIDGFDVVVRVNKGVEVIDEQHEFVGSKTDVLFHCLFEDQSKGGSPITPELWKKHDVKKIVFSHNYKYTSYAFNYFYTFLKKTKKLIKVSQVPKQLYFDNMNVTKPLGPTTGFVAINTVFNCKPKELYITGVTFFKTGHNKSYRNVEKKDLSAIKMEDFHSVEKEFQHVKNMYFSNIGIVKPDTVLQQIFENN